LTGRWDSTRRCCYGENSSSQNSGLHYQQRWVKGEIDAFV